MNLSGLTITINAGKSNLPHKAKTPISLLTREILQHAHTIEQAIDIAAKRQVFVAESILIGSAEDRKAVILEISPQKLEIYEVDHERGQLISTNHFKSEGYQQDKRNLEQVANSHSLYRFQRVSELIINQKQLNPQKMAHLLRDRMGLQEQELGMGNEKAINQLIAHHSVIFQPEDRIMWVSTAPYQLGEFVGYRLDQIFASKSIDEPMVRPDTALTLAADPFSKSQAFRNYEHYRTGFNSIQSMDKSQHLTHEELKNFQALNPSFWKTHAILGKYYADRKQTALALHHYTEAVKLEVSSINERRALLKRIKRLQKRAD